MALAAAAGATYRVRLGFGVLVLPLRAIAWLAAQIATLQHVSSDRVVLVELRAIGTAWPEMEGRLQLELARLREDGFAGVVLGDIHLADVRAGYEERVTTAGLEHVEPIWGESPMTLVSEFAESGGRAVITCVDRTRLEPSWLGRIVDESFPDEILVTGIDPCGEHGEYHSFAFQGPMFDHPVSWRPGETRIDSRFSQLDVLLKDSSASSERPQRLPWAGTP